MNMSKLTLATALAFVLAATPVFAAHKPSHPDRSDRMAKSEAQFPPKGDMLRDTMTYPFRMLGRTAITVVHTPSIVRDSFAGERTIRSDDGRLWGRKDGRYDRDPLFD